MPKVHGHHHSNHAHASHHTHASHDHKHHHKKAKLEHRHVTAPPAAAPAVQKAADPLIYAKPNAPDVKKLESQYEAAKVAEMRKFTEVVYAIDNSAGDHSKALTDACMVLGNRLMEVRAQLGLPFSEDAVIRDVNPKFPKAWAL